MVNKIANKFYCACAQKIIDVEMKGVIGFATTEKLRSQSQKKVQRRRR